MCSKNRMYWSSVYCKIQCEESLQVIANKLRPANEEELIQYSELISFLLFHSVLMIYTVESPDKSSIINDGIVDTGH